MDWYVFVITQDVNIVKEGTDPEKAAKTIGGFILTTQLKAAFNEPKIMH